MKTENTLENKAAFFAQYWGIWVHCDKLGYRGRTNPENINGGDYLLLTPLSAITDEDAIEVGYMLTERSKSLSANIFSKEDFFAWGVRQGMRPVMSLMQCVNAVDYLRSKGYLIGWRDLSVQDLIEYGWAKEKH